MKNAGIKSKEELRKRLESGEKGLFIGSLRLSYDESKIYEGESPYRYETHVLKCYWDSFADVTKQVSWFDTVSEENPVLCMVWDNHETNFRYSLITGYTQDSLAPFLTGDTGVCWKHAEPITKDSKYIYKAD